MKKNTILSFRNYLWYARVMKLAIHKFLKR